MVGRDPRRSGQPLTRGLEEQAARPVAAEEIEEQRSWKRKPRPQEDGAAEEHGSPSAFEELSGDPAPALAPVIRQPQRETSSAFPPAATPVQEAARPGE